MDKMKNNPDLEQDKVGFVRKLNDFRTFIEKSQLELKKVVWPSKQETVSTSSAVLLLVVVMAFFLGILDLGLTKFIAAILS